MPKGGCHCGSVRYSVEGELRHSAVCHCESCRRTTGGLATAWVGYPDEGLTVTGKTSTYSSSEGVERHFCGHCGTSLFYFNEAGLPGVVDILTVTLDDPQDFPPALHVQMAGALPWEESLEGLPRFAHFPGQ